MEIYADDVKCSHGSTSGSIDLNSIHYLKSRGIPEKEVYQMLINGFLSKFLEKLPEDNLKKFLIEKDREDKSMDIKNIKKNFQFQTKN